MPPIPAPVSLNETLSGLDPNTLAQAMADMQAQELAANTQQATQSAQQAGQQYQEAAQAPSPDIGAAAAFIPTLLSNLASVIGQEPSYRENTQQNIRQQKADLLKNRADNLQALRDVWSQKAEVAQRAGDLELHEKALTQRERIDKEYQKILDMQKHGYAMEEIAARKPSEDAAVAKDAREERKRQQADTRIQNSAIASINSSVRQDPDIKQFVTIRDQITAGRRGAAQKSNLGDIILMRAIARATDPLSSVREEEFRTFKGAQGVMQRAGVSLTKEMWGRGMLSDFGRQQMLSQLDGIYEAKLGQHDRALNQYKLQAAAMGIDPELVLRQYTAIDEKPQDQEQPTVLLQAPDGSKRMVKASQVPGLIKQGAKRVSK